MSAKQVDDPAGRAYVRSNTQVEASQYVQGRVNKQPYVIGVVAIHGRLADAKFSRLSANVNDVVNRLNAVFNNKTFLFHVCSPHQPPGVGPSSGNRSHADETIWSLLAPLVPGNQYDAVVGIVDDYLQEASFNRQNNELHCGVVTTAEAQNFIPPGLGILDYLIYLVLCVSVLLRSDPTLQEHPQKEACLLDLCENRAELSSGLLHASAEHCRITLTGAGFTDEDVSLINLALKQVRRRDPLLITAHFSPNAIPFLAGVAFSFCAAIVSTLFERAGIVISSVLLGVTAWLLLARFTIRSTMAVRRRVSAEIVISILGAVIIVLLVLWSLMFKIPHL